MNKQGTAALMVIGGAIVGAIGYCIVFWVIAMFIDRSLAVQPLDRALNFGGSFGLVGGAFVATAMLEKGANKQPPMIALVLTGLALLFALYALFFGGGWSAIFSGGIAEWPMIFIWGLSVGGLVKVFGK